MLFLLSRPAALFFLVVFTALLTSCKKEGPAGPAGPAGPPGATGETGESGATLISSGWLDVDLLSGIYSGVYYGKIEDERITQDIVDKGVIKVYVLAFGQRAYELPNALFGSFYFSFAAGQIELFSPTQWDSPDYKYRFVLIPADE